MFRGATARRVKYTNHCYLLGVFTIIICIIMMTLSVMLLMPVKSERVLSFLTEFKMSALGTTSVSILTMIVVTLWTAVSVLLIIGVKRNVPGFVLCYLMYGINMTLYLNMVTLLLLLHRHWIVGLFLIILTMVYIPCLVAVHRVYNLMVGWRHIRENPQRLFEESAAPSTIPVNCV